MATNILAIAAGRGGTGKSTLAFAIADTIRTLYPSQAIALLDLDPQAGLTGYAKQRQAADPLHDPPVDVHGIPFYRSGRLLAQATDAEMAEHIERVYRGVPDRVVVADMAPAIENAGHRAMFLRDDVMVLGAIKTEPGSFQSLNELVALLVRRGLPYMLVPTLHRNIVLNNTMLLTMRQQHQEHVTDITVPMDGKAAECVVAGRPVTMYARRSKAAKAIEGIVTEIFGEPEPVAEPSGRRAQQEAV